MRLTRPLAFFDLETTGVDPADDRIVQFAAVRHSPDGEVAELEMLVNPGRPIPAGATEVHGITDEHVAKCPPFADVAGAIVEFLHGCDLAGFNSIRFDGPLLDAELVRVGQSLRLDERKLVDAQVIYHRHFPRNLTTALKQYTDCDHTDAHDALADVHATMAILGRQVDLHDIPATVEGLHDWIRGPGALDSTGKFREVEGKVVFNFGKHKGKPIATQQGYLKWMLGQDFPGDAKAIIKKALRG